MFCFLPGSPAGGIYMLLSRTDPFTYFYAYDGNGNVAALVNAADGTAAAQYEYDPFGNCLMSIGRLTTLNLNAFLFSTKYQDSESGLLYYGYRYYDPRVGRWPNRDRLEEQGGKGIYSYCANNPLSFSDRNGLDFGFWIGAGPAYDKFTGGNIQNIPVTPNQVDTWVDMNFIYFFGQGQSETLSPQDVDVVINTQEVRLFRDNLRTSAESRMCKTPCGQQGSYFNSQYDDTYFPFSQLTGNWQLYMIGEVKWRGQSDQHGGCNQVAHESVHGIASKTFTYAATPGGNPRNKVSTFFLLPSIAYITGSGSYYISGDFDIEFDFSHDCPCKNMAK